MEPTLRDTVIAVTLRIMKPAPSPGHDHNAEAFLLAFPDLGTGHALDSEISLATMQQACLLAFYAFHNSPGQRAWTRIGHLTRKAYSLGLSQLDAERPPSTLCTRRQREDLDEWRRVWWMIYCLVSVTAAHRSHEIFA